MCQRGKIIICLVLIFNFSDLHAVRFDLGYNYLVRELEASSERNSLPKTVLNKTIIQPLDHFNSTENRKWEMRYFENTEFWKENGPILLFIGGEGAMSPWWLTKGMLYELAKEVNGAMFGSEHRYYGKSIPLDISNVENLRYLNARQALEDIVYLLNYIRSSEKFKTSKVVVLGGSYPGNLAAWMKLLYPELVTAALASSAPVLAKVDFFEYLETVADDYEQYGLPECLEKVVDIFKTYETLLNSTEGIEQLKKDENVCESTDFTKEDNKGLFFMSKTYPLMGNAQYGRPETLQRHCKRILKTSRAMDEDFDSKELWRDSDDCYDYDFDEWVKWLKLNLHPWLFQTCNEFGYYQTTSSPSYDTFGKRIPVEIYYKMCVGLFGEEFDKNGVDRNVNESNVLYQGLKPDVKHVVFTNGELDPWMRLGVLEDLSYEAPSVMIPRASHCSDLLPERESDPQELKETRKYIIYLIKQWIGFKDNYE